MKKCNDDGEQILLKDAPPSMRPARMPLRSAVAIALGFAACSLGPVACFAEAGVRDGQTELYLGGMYMDGNSVEGVSSGIAVELDPSVAGGVIGLGHNFNDHLNLNVELGIGAAEVKGSAMGKSTELRPAAYSTVVGLDWNVLNTRVTPFATGSGGFIGYTGDGVSETDWIAGVGGGVRWDISDRIMAKLLYRANFSAFQDVDDSVLYHTVTVGVGWKF